MTAIDPSRLAVCSWSLQPANPGDLLERVRATGLRRVQLALSPIVGDPAWADAPRMLADAGVAMVSGMFGTVGEDYTTLESIRRTGGIVPDEHWPANLAHALNVAERAANLNLPRVSFHAGFIPEDASMAKLVDRLGEMADLYAERGVALLLETGQETADALLGFLDAVDRASVGVNFDPANMILYDKGDPVASFTKLAPRVRQVHIKDAVRTARPGEWGTEVPVGDGDVDWPAFLGALDAAGYGGDLVIEREAGEARVADVRRAAELLTGRG